MTVPAGLELVATLRGHTGEIRRLAWSPTGLQLATPSGDGSVRVWDAASGELLHTLDGHTDTVHAVAWSPDGELLASGGVDGRVMLWEADGSRIGRMESTGAWVNCLAWSPDGRLLVVGYESGELVVWVVGQERVTWRGVARVSGGAVNAVAWAPVSRRFAVASMRGAVALHSPDGSMPISHLQRWALPGSVSTIRRVVCSACAEPFAEDIVRFRRERGLVTITCSRGRTR